MNIVSSHGKTTITETDHHGDDRRLLSTASNVVPVQKLSGLDQYEDAIQKIKGQPISSNMPSMEFNVDVPQVSPIIYIRFL
jgi:hypothetical protein